MAVFGVLPYVDKRLELTVGGARRERDTEGLGDLTLFGRYTAFRKDWPQRTFRIAPFVLSTTVTTECRRYDRRDSPDRSKG